MQIEFIAGDSNAEDEEGDQTETEGPAQGTAGAESRTTTCGNDLFHSELHWLTSSIVTMEQINQVLGQHGPLRRLLMSHYRLVNRRDQDEDDEDYSLGYGGFSNRRRRKPKAGGNRFPKVPSEQGRALMASGIYGGRDNFTDVRRKRKTNVSERLMWRQLGLDPRSSTRRANRLIAQVGHSEQG